jgi:hypothetical protein
LKAGESPVARTKTATLNLRVDPALKDALREAAAREHRSVANMVEILIREHCRQANIPIPEQNELFPEVTGE